PMQAPENVMLASTAAEAAPHHGKFSQMAHALYRSQWTWTKAPAPHAILTDKARELGLDLDQFQTDLDGTEVRERIGADQTHAKSVGVKTAPSVVINGYNVPNSEFGENGFRTAIKAALAKAAP